ncbi:MAG: 3-phosphoshikimate 1-carboxyvinyltransferase [Candidatus Omnitrophica bacterium]|nr:3-phosphoshikimate 1-carboxyvinyltransferase [Candidatus Omnitrophota bacterium]
MNIKIKPVKKIVGELSVPGDKSISHRALMIGALALGPTKIKGLPESDDCNHTAKAFREMGIDIREESNTTIVEGKGLHGLKKPADPLYVGNSGTSMRILAGILAGQRFDSTITGDTGISARPMKRIVEPLSMMGVKIRAQGDGEYPPLAISGGSVKPITYKNLIASAQVKSAILFAGLYSKGTTKVIEPVRSRDHTERMLKYFGAKVKISGQSVSIKGGSELRARAVEIPGDISSASFFMAAATLLKGSRIKMLNISINPTRAGILKVLSRMGADIEVVNKKKLGSEPAADIIVRYSKTHGITITKEMVPSIIDELPVIFVLASLSKGVTTIEGVGELRVKETDRIRSMQDGLKAMGVVFRVKGDSVMIEGIRSLKGASLQSFGDHRTCMALAVAALAAEGDSDIEGTESISKSFPSFFDILFKLTLT